MSSKASKPAPAAKGKKPAVSDSSSSSASSSSGSDSDATPAARTKAAAAKGKPAAAAAPAKAKAKAKAASSSSESDDSGSDSDAPVKAKAKAKAAAAAPAKSKGKAKAAAASSDDDSASDSDDGAAKKKPAPKTAAKKPAAAAAKKPVNAFAGLDGESEEESEDGSSSSASSESEEDAKPSKTAAGKKAAASAAAAAPASKAAGKGAKAAAAAAPAAKDAGEDDLDAILNDLSLGGGAGAAGTTDESKMTKAQLKRLRQKQKQEAEKNAPADASAAAAAASPSAADEEKKAAAEAKKAKAAADKPTAKGAPGKGNKAMEALKEKIRAQKEEDERRQREEAERVAAIEAERIRLEEEERLAAAEKERKSQARIKAREEARKAGALLSKTEKAAQAKREAFLKQLAASGATLPAALAEKVTPAAGAEDGAEASPDAAADGAAPGGATGEKRPNKKDAFKKKSAFGKRMEAQKEADRIRAERHAAEDVSRVAQKEEEARRKAEDIEIAERNAAALAALDDEERALDVVTPEAPESADEEEVLDSWEDVDSEEDRRKATEKEERRQAAFKAKQQRAKAKEAARVALAKKRDEVARQAEIEAAELKKRRQVIDDQRKQKAAEAIKAQQEQDRQAQAVAAGFELESDHQSEAASSSSATAASASSSGAASSGGGKSDKRKGDLRSPIACILGHVDTGKTKILDNIRATSVQAHEAGGITQQIGATFMPRANILSKTAELNKFLGRDLRMDMPGLLVIDTPGHESFTNLRSRGSNLCDIAILVIDIMHGLEPQTIESINLLKQRKTPFVIALNKIDRCYGWKVHPNAPFQVTYNAQQDSTKGEFEKRAAEACVLMAQQGLNVELYYKNTDFRKYISVVPTSAITGEGIPDLLMLLVQLTQTMMNERLSYVSELSCTVLEVKVVEGLGTTIDVILVNGVLNEGDTIVVCGLTGPIVTTIRALLTPPPMQEIRVKSDYVHHKMVRAAMGVKISAAGLESAIAGSSLLVCKKGDDIEELKDEVQGDLATILSKVDKSGQGVAVQASTLGSLEALLSFLGDMKIPVSSISIGPVYKKDVMKAAVMLEKRPEFGVMLCFDVKVSADAAKIAEEMGVKIFTADIIYHLFDQCTKWMEEVKARKRESSADVAVFPCVLDILPNAVFNVKAPIVLGVRVVDGVARVGTPICIPSKQFLSIGRITGIQKNHVDFQEAKKGEEFACKIEQSKSDQQIVFGRHFDASSQLVSKISRESIDMLKANFKDDLSDSEWKLVVKLKKVFDIM